MDPPLRSGIVRPPLGLLSALIRRALRDLARAMDADGAPRLPTLGVDLAGHFQVRDGSKHQWILELRKVKHCSISFIILRRGSASFAPGRTRSARPQLGSTGGSACR